MVMYDHQEEEENAEDMAGMDEKLMDTPEGLRLAPWRRKLGNMVESATWEKWMLTFLGLDILIFFVKLLILEDMFGHDQWVHVRR